MQNERTKESRDKGARGVVLAEQARVGRELRLLCLTDVNEG
jgi:hypothetical protein